MGIAVIVVVVIGRLSSPFSLRTPPTPIFVCSPCIFLRLYRFRRCQWPKQLPKSRTSCFPSIVIFVQISINSLFSIQYSSSVTSIIDTMALLPCQWNGFNARGRDLSMSFSVRPSAPMGEVCRQNSLVEFLIRSHSIDSCSLALVLS